MSAGDVVNLIEGQMPADYHCRCEFCSRVIGELRPPGGGYYSRLERREYYDPIEKGSGEDAHIAKSPLHMARWMVQAYTDPGDWVLDPTIGAGTTAVEAITQGRNVAGMELQYGNALKANLMKARDMAKPLENTGLPPVAKIRIGDARRIGAFLDEVGSKFTLIFNNPPYSGDESPSPIPDRKFMYKENLPNLAFLKENSEYWDAIATIWGECAAHLKTGGVFGFGVKDMVRNRQPVMLHQTYNEVLAARVGLKHIGTAFLKHHPRTFHLNRYFRTFGVHPPYYQTISVFERPEGWKLL